MGMARVRRKWTPEEDALLRTAVKAAQAGSRPLLWRELAKSVPGRTNKDCRRRWWNSLANGTAKGSWSEEEDERLIAAVRRHGPNWIRVSADVGSRSADQCSSHWSQVLDPNINYCDWTAEEDTDLLHAVCTYGTNWATIAGSHRPNRTTLALRNRYSTLRLQNNNNRNKSKADWTRKGRASRPASSATKASKPTKEADWNLEALQDHTRNGNDRASQSSDEGDEDDEDVDDDDDEDDEDDDDDDDDDEEEENGNAENGDERRHQISLESPMKVMPNSRGAPRDIDATHIPSPNPSLTSWDPWAMEGIVPANSADYKSQSINPENSAMERTNQMQYQTLFGLNGPSQYSTPEENYFYSLSDSGAMDTSAPKPVYDTNSIDMPLPTPTTIFPVSSQPVMAPPTPSTVNGRPTVPAPAQSRDRASSSTSASTSTGRQNPGTSPPVLNSDSPQSATLYRVSITMACTEAQLDANMIRLAGLGSSVTIQIEKKTEMV